MIAATSVSYRRRAAAGYLIVIITSRIRILCGISAIAADNISIITLVTFQVVVTRIIN